MAAQTIDAHDWNPLGHYLMGKALGGEGEIRIGHANIYSDAFKLSRTT